MNFANNDALKSGLGTFGGAWIEKSCGTVKFHGVGESWSGLNMFTSNTLRLTDATHSVVSFDFVNPSASPVSVLVKLTDANNTVAYKAATVDSGSHSVSVNFDGVSGWSASKVYKQLTLFPGFGSDDGKPNDGRIGNVYTIDNLSINGGTSSDVSVISGDSGTIVSTDGLTDNGCSSYTKSIAVGTSTNLNFNVKINGTPVSGRLMKLTNGSPSDVYLNIEYGVTNSSGNVTFNVTGISRSASSTGLVPIFAASAPPVVAADSVTLSQTGTRPAATKKAVAPLTFASAAAAGACGAGPVVDSTLPCAFSGAKATLAVPSGSAITTAHTTSNGVLQIVKTSAGDPWSGVNVLSYKSTAGTGFNGKGIKFDYYNPNPSPGPVLVKVDGANNAEQAIKATPGWGTYTVNIGLADPTKEYVTVVLFPNFGTVDGATTVANTGAEKYLVDNFGVVNSIWTSDTLPATVVDSNTGITFGATASSGNAAVSTTTASVCGYSNGKVTFVSGAGTSGGATCTVKVNAAASGTSWAAATALTYTIKVYNKFPNAITVGTVPATKALGDADFTIPSAASATASSGGTVTRSSTSTAICTITGNTVHIVASGSCVVKYDSAATGDYRAATTVSKTIVVSQSTPTATSANKLTVARGGSVTVTGSNYIDGYTKVTVGGTAATVTAVTSTTVTFTVASGTGVGTGKKIVVTVGTKAATALTPALAITVTAS